MAIEAEKQAVIRNGLIIISITVKVEAAKAFTATTQYFRYQGYNHNPRTYKNESKYRLYAGNHSIWYHKCSTYNASGTYSHLQPLYSNYKGPHLTNHTEYEVYQAIKARRPIKSLTSSKTNSIIGFITNPIRDSEGDIGMNGSQPIGSKNS